MSTLDVPPVDMWILFTHEAYRVYTRAPAGHQDILQAKKLGSYFHTFMTRAIAQCRDYSSFYISGNDFEE